MERRQDPLPPTVDSTEPRTSVSGLFRLLPRAATITGSQKEHFRVELFCGITPLRARPTRETLRGIYRGPGERRGARRPARAFEELLSRDCYCPVNARAWSRWRPASILTTSSRCVSPCTIWWPTRH